MMIRIIFLGKILLFVICCQGQQKVYYPNLIQFPGRTLVGNINYNTIDGQKSYFNVYTMNDIDNKTENITIAFKVLNDSIVALKKTLDFSLKAFEEKVIDTLLKSIDDIRAVFSQEIVKQIREETLAAIKTEIDKLRIDMQKQIDELNKKIH